MNQVWDDSVAFVRRESALLIPLTLATIYIGNVGAGLAQWNGKTDQPSIVANALLLAAVILSIVGQLAVVSLVLTPGQSVGEALRKGATRLGKLFLVVLVIALVLTLAAIPLSIVMVANGLEPGNPDTMRNLPAWMVLVILIASAGGVWLAIRLSLVNVLIVDRNPGVVETLKQGFALTRGMAARLCLVALLYGAVLLVLSTAVRFVAGSLFALIGDALDSPFAGTVMTSLVDGLVTAALSLVATVFIAQLYRRVSAGS